MKKNLIRPFLLTLLCPMPMCLHAQDVRKVNCRLISFSSGAELNEVVTKDSKAAETSTPLSSRKLSESDSYEAPDNKITFFHPTEKITVATATLPAKINNAILIFIQSPSAKKNDDAAKWQIMAIEDSKKAFPAGGALVANFFNQPIRFAIGEHKGTLKPGRTQAFTKPTMRDNFNMSPVIVQVRQDDKWITANESVLRFVPTSRYLIFAFPDPKSGRPRIKSIKDRKSFRP